MVKLVNRAKMTTATTGTGTITLGSAVDGFQTFDAAGVADADVVRYVIEDGTAWEIGLGTYGSAGGTLTRGSIESSTGSALNLSGDAVVFVTASGEDILQPTDIASQAEAEAGIDNTKLMTPLRTAQAARAIGEPFAVWDHLPGAQTPNNSGVVKYIRLTAGQSGSGGYNEGLLTDETVSGSAPLVEADAEIVVGPMAGQRVPLINTEMSFIRPGTDSGALQFDQMQRLTGAMEPNTFELFVCRAGSVTSVARSGVFSKTTLGESVNASTNSGGRSVQGLAFDSIDSPDARASSTTDGETRSKNRQATFYMRIV